MCCHTAISVAFSERHRMPPRAVHARTPEVEPREQYLLQVPNNYESCTCHCEHWTDQSSVDLIANSVDLVSKNYSSDHMSKMDDNVEAILLPDSDLQFDVVEWPLTDFGISETPPYSHDIYAACSPSISYPVEINDIEAVLDCDISTLDAYLHSTSGSSVTATAGPPASQPQPCNSSQPSNYERTSSPDDNPVGEFFPDLYEVSPPSAPLRRRNHSSETVRSSLSRYSPYSADGSSADAYNEYRKRRDKNNIASQRSRQKRAEKMREMRAEKDILERRNIELKTLLSSLEAQVADYKRMVLIIVSK